MAKRIKGKCKFCGKEYTLSYMKKHLPECEARRIQLAGEKEATQCGYFDLMILPKYFKDYWLFIEVRDTSTLKDIDFFLRDIWLECCNHLSDFNINGTHYENEPIDDLCSPFPPKSMDYKLNTIWKKDMTIEYRYDFGSTTTLLINVMDHRIGPVKKETLTILSRNNPYVYQCSECGKKTAVALCAECAWTGENFLCDDCCKTHKCGEYMLLDICNSPRMGVCGYCGSKIYPDQFMSDVEESGS